MRFDMTKPCNNCPFLLDVNFPLSPARAEDICTELLKGKTFQCHKTLDYACNKPAEQNQPQHCAGAAIFLEKQNAPNQLMRIAERLGQYDYNKLDMEAKVFTSTEAMVKQMHYLENRNITSKE